MTPVLILLWMTSFGAPMAVVTALLVSSQLTLRAGVRLQRQVDRWAPAALLPAGLLALLGPAAGRVDLPWLLSGTGLYADEVARPLLVVVVLLYAAALIAVRASQTPRAPTLIGFLMVCFIGNAGVLLSTDAMTFYLGYSVMSLAAYGVVVHTGTDAARSAGRIYLGLTVLSEMLVLAALVLVVAEGGLLLADAPSAVAQSQQRDLIITLLVAGFGIKAGTVPLHFWLPLAHPAAPPPASAVLSGCMIKVGLLGWLRFLPLGEVALPTWGTILVVLALVGAFAALPFGVLTRDPKVSLAYSSISQMAFVTVLVGIALATPHLAQACVLAAVVYAVHHGMAKGGLFLGVTIWRIHGSGRMRVPVLVVLAVMALAVAGAPLSSGAVAKYAAKQAADPVVLAGVDLGAILPWVGTVTTLLLIRAGYLLLTGTQRQPSHSPGLALGSWMVLGGGGLVLAWYLAERWGPVVEQPGAEPSAWWDAVWPIGAGLVLTLAWWLLLRAGMLPRALRPGHVRMLPAGDIVVAEQRAERDLARMAAGIARGTARVDAARPVRALRARLTSGVGVAERVESRLSGWVASGVAFLALVLIVAVAAWR